MKFLAIADCETHFERIVPKSVERDMEKLLMKFLALNVDFDGPSLDFLGLRKPVHESIKERYHHKSCYFTLLASRS